jgi:hypothetical protein
MPTATIRDAKTVHSQSATSDPRSLALRPGTVPPTWIVGETDACHIPAVPLYRPPNACTDCP